MTTQHAAPTRRRATRRERAGLVARSLAATVIAIVLLFPLYWMVVVALSPRSELLSTDLRLWPRQVTLDNLSRVTETFPVVTWFGNSLAITSVTTILTVLVSLWAGYAFAQLRFTGRTLLLVLTLSTMMVPVQVVIVSQFRLVTELGLYGTYWAVILPTAGTAFGVFLARQFILGLPSEVIDAAKVDGAGHGRIFWRIVVPLCRPLIAVLTLLTVLSTWNDFAWPLVALKQNELFTLPIGLLYLQGQFGPDYGATMAFALLSVIPMVVLFLVFQRQFVQGFARSGLR